MIFLRNPFIFCDSEVKAVRISFLCQQRSNETCNWCKKRPKLTQNFVDGKIIHNNLSIRFRRRYISFAISLSRAHIHTMRYHLVWFGLVHFIPFIRNCCYLQNIRLHKMKICWLFIRWTWYTHTHTRCVDQKTRQAHRIQGRLNRIIAVNLLKRDKIGHFI